MPRAEERGAGTVRELRFIPGFIGSAAGSCLAVCGRTRVICTASVDPGVPPWLEGRRQGWVTAEYGMLPASTGRRKARDGRSGRADGRALEIQRLVGRVLRPVVDLQRLGAITVTLDCDVIEADGGTRTTSINGAFVALSLALRSFSARGRLAEVPLRGAVGALSVGVVEGEVLLDLDYSEDSRADADMNVVMDDGGGFLEIQATGEKRPFSREELDRALDLVAAGIRQVFEAQRAALEVQGGAP